MPEWVFPASAVVLGFCLGVLFMLAVRAIRKADRTVTDLVQTAHATGYSNVRQIAVRRAPACGFCGQSGHVTVDCDDKQLGEAGPTGGVA